MAKITITIQDIENGMVTIKSDPTMETMAKMFQDDGLTAAHSFAVAAMMAMKKEAMLPDQKKEKSSLIL